MASYLTINEYRILTGLDLSNLNEVYVNSKLSFWSTQLRILSTQNFGLQNLLRAKTYNIRNCKDYKIFFSGWRPFPKVEVRQIGTLEWQELKPDSDFRWVYPHFTTTQNGVEIENPVVGIDFSCLSCRCCCEELRLIGDSRWSVGLPDDLNFILLDLVSVLLQTDNKAYIGGLLPSSELWKQIRSETDQTRSISWFRDENNLKTNNQKLSSGFNSPEYSSVFAKYQTYSFNNTYRFYA